MTDEPTKNPSDQPAEGADQPTQPTQPTPPTPPSEPSGVGFAALRQPGQQPPAQPPQPPAQPPPPPAQPPQGIPPAAYPPPPPGPVGYQSASAPPPAPGPGYQYDYSRIPPNRGSGPSMLLIGGLAFAMVLVVGAGALFALGLGPFARPTARPTPSLVAQPTQTAASITPGPTTATAPPDASTTGGVAPSATPIGDVKAALLSHIPEAIADTCFVSAPDDASTIVALAVCAADDGNIALTYFQYDSYDSMFTTYEGFRLASQIGPDSGDCNDHSSWPAEQEFNIGGEPAGRWLCTEELGQTSIYWTDSRLNILSQATQTDVDYDRLIDFWVHESGPDL